MKRIFLEIKLFLFDFLPYKMRINIIRACFEDLFKRLKKDLHKSGFYEFRSNFYEYFLFGNPLIIKVPCRKCGKEGFIKIPKPINFPDATVLKTKIPTKEVEITIQRKKCNKCKGFGWEKISQ